MNTAKWNVVATEFERGLRVPANGWEAWAEAASREAVEIRDAIPEGVEILLEVGCGVGRLTPYLGLLFPHVVATDTSPVCRRVTEERCKLRGNVLVLDPDEAQAEPADCALVWRLYDEDWSDATRDAHARSLMDRYPVVLFSPPTPRLSLRNGESVTTRDEMVQGENRDFYSTGKWMLFER